MNTINKSQLFKNAHKITKEIKGDCNYKATFKLVLIFIFEELKQGKNIDTIVAEMLTPKKKGVKKTMKKIKMLSNVKIKKVIESQRICEFDDGMKLIIFHCDGFTYENELTLTIQDMEFNEIETDLIMEDLEDTTENVNTLLLQAKKIKTYLEKQGYSNIQILERNI